MEPERWKQIDRLLEAVQERPSGERNSFLRDACAGDEALEREIRSLLAAQEKAGKFLESPALEATARAVALQQASDAASPSSAGTVTHLDAGGRFGPYRIEGPLGAGGMGEVFRATDTRLGRAVAIKTCRIEFSERFHREARAISSLNHPHICTLHDVGPDYLVMELIEGETLGERLKRGKLPTGQVIQYGSQIAEALSAAHAKNIIHRDLKPGNIMIARNGVKVLDFGLARSPQDQTITAARMVVGTPAYMAPEQSEGRECDVRTDIYALGLVLREMSTGSRQGSTLGLPGQLAHIIDRCLETDPEERWQSAWDVAKELKWSTTVAAAPIAARSSAGARWAAAAAVLLAALAGIFWLRPAQPRPVQVARFSTELARVGRAGGTVRLDDTILHREQPGNFMAISPDGSRLVVQVLDTEDDMARNQIHKGIVRLATRRLDEAQFKPLLGTEDPTAPFFSPDGQWIAFFGNGKLRKIPAQGGVPATLSKAGLFASGSWGDDGNIIAALSELGGLSRLPSAGGDPVALTELRKGELMHRWPQVLPGSRAVLFTSYTGGGPEDGSIEVLSLKSRERKTLVRGGVMGKFVPVQGDAGYLIYLHQHTLLATAFDAGKLAVTGSPQPIVDDISSITSSTPGDFDVSGNGTFVYLSGKGEGERSIFWLDSAGERQPLHATPGLYNGLRFSPDGNRLVFAIGAAGKQQDLWVKDLERNTLARLTSLAGASHSPVWFPDGKHLLFGVQNQPNSGVYWVRSDGGAEPRQLLQEDQPVFPTSIAPDGKRVILQRGDPHTLAEAVTAQVEGLPDQPALGKQDRVLRTPIFPMAAFSPDGHWLAYESTETGVEEVYVQPFPGPGEKIAISAGSGEFPAWARNSRELFFMSGNLIMSVDYSTTGGTFKPGKPRVWSHQPILEVDGPFQPYEPAPDSKRCAVLLYPNGTADQRSALHLTFILNFGESLRQRAGVP
jgi:Tol biopolymer transport system component